MTTTELKTLTDAEQKAFQLIHDGKSDEVVDYVRSGQVRVNCLDKSGMNLLDQACFKGDERLVEFLIENKASVDNRAHAQGYTCLMFAALTGKPTLCQRLLDAGARPHAQNTIGKTASELAAFVGQHECVSVISSYIDWEQIDQIVHPNGANSVEQFPCQMVDFIHRLTRTNEVHPVRLSLGVMGSENLLEHRKKILYTIDRLFEKQLRSKEPNEILSMKLWLILFTLRELLKFLDQKLQNIETSTNDKIDDSSSVLKAIRLFIKNLLQASSSDLVRPVEERFLRAAVFAFPYKQSMLYQALSKALNQIDIGSPPSAYTIICQALFGHRFVETAHFCLTCGVPSAQKRCKLCKFPYCSAECQKLDRAIHKNLCEEMAKRRAEIDDNLQTGGNVLECNSTENNDDQSK